MVTDPNHWGGHVGMHWLHCPRVCAISRRPGITVVSSGHQSGPLGSMLPKDERLEPHDDTQLEKVKAWFYFSVIIFILTIMIYFFHRHTHTCVLFGQNIPKVIPLSMPRVVIDSLFDTPLWSSPSGEMLKLRQAIALHPWTWLSPTFPTVWRVRPRCPWQAWYPGTRISMFWMCLMVKGHCIYEMVMHWELYQDHDEKSQLLGWLSSVTDKRLEFNINGDVSTWGDSQ